MSVCGEGRRVFFFYGCLRGGSCTYLAVGKGWVCVCGGGRRDYVVLREGCKSVFGARGKSQRVVCGCGRGCVVYVVIR